MGSVSFYPHNSAVRLRGHMDPVTVRGARLWTGEVTGQGQADGE